MGIGLAADKVVAAQAVESPVAGMVADRFVAVAQVAESPVVGKVADRVAVAQAAESPAAGMFADKVVAVAQVAENPAAGKVADRVVAAVQAAESPAVDMAVAAARVVPDLLSVGGQPCVRRRCKICYRPLYPLRSLNTSS